MSVLSLSYQESDVTITSISQGLPTSWRENNWHRYGMNKLHQYHTMYTLTSSKSYLGYVGPGQLSLHAEGWEISTIEGAEALQMGIKTGMAHSTSGQMCGW